MRQATIGATSTALSVTTPINVSEYEARAHECLPQMVYDYYAGGADDEVTLKENVQAWSRLRLRPRVLTDVTTVDTTTAVVGQMITCPLLTAPCGFNALAHPDGESGVARAAHAA